MIKVQSLKVKLASTFDKNPPDLHSGGHNLLNLVTVYVIFGTGPSKASSSDTDKVCRL